MHVSKISRRELFAGAGALLAGCVCSRTPAAAGQLRGPFPILTTPYDEDGRVDFESLAREAEFVADSGCPGVIWCQSNDAIDLLTFEEKRRGYETLAKVLQGRNITLTLGCNGVDKHQMLREAAAVEEVAVAYPRTHVAIISRPPDTGKTMEDVRDYYEALGRVARRPVIIQTWVSPSCPVPSVELLVDLAKRYPGTFGYIKEECDGDKANDRMVRENAAKPAIRTVFSAWGAWQWLYQSRQCGSEGVISERCAYAPLLMFIWNRMENGDKDGRLTEAFALFRLLIDQRGFPREDMRGYALYYFKRLGLFRTTLTRQYKNGKSEAQGTVSIGTDAHEWKLEDLRLSSSQRAELDRCYDDMLRFLRR